MSDEQLARLAIDHGSRAWDILTTQLLIVSGRSFLVWCFMGTHEWGLKTILGGILLAVFMSPFPFLSSPSQQVAPPSPRNRRVIPDTLLALANPPTS